MRPRMVSSWRAAERSFRVREGGGDGGGAGAAGGCCTACPACGPGRDSGGGSGVPFARSRRNCVIALPASATLPRFTAGLPLNQQAHTASPLTTKKRSSSPTRKRCGGCSGRSRPIGWAGKGQEPSYAASSGFQPLAALRGTHRLRERATCSGEKEAKGILDPGRVHERSDSSAYPSSDTAMVVIAWIGACLASTAARAAGQVAEAGRRASRLVVNWRG